MMKFATFESTVELIYDKVLQKPKSEYSKLQQVSRARVKLVVFLRLTLL